MNNATVRGAQEPFQWGRQQPQTQVGDGPFSLIKEGRTPEWHGINFCLFLFVCLFNLVEEGAVDHKNLSISKICCIN